MPTIFIDNLPYEVKEGRNLLETCLSLGFDLPYFCWHPAMGSVGACRQCAVKIFKDENDSTGRIMMSCMEAVKEGLRLSIADPTARAFRKQNIEWLMTNHPHDCPVCDEGGSCHLQDMTVMTGHDYRRYTFKKRTHVNQYLGPLLNHEMNRCIQCYRCVRFYREYAGGTDLNVFGAHHHVYFGREKDGVLESPFSGNLAEVCPTGVFTDKTLKQHYTRKWDLTSAPSICQHCSMGCNIIAGERYGKLRCIVNRYNSDVNGYFICDKGRYGYEFVNSVSRIAEPLIRNQPVEAVNETALMRHLEGLVTQFPLVGIGSPRASMESNFALMELVGKENFFQGTNDDQAYLERRMVEMLQQDGLPGVSLKAIENADAVLILGEDIWNTAPMMALAVRQSVMKTAADQAVQQSSLANWHDAAIKELVQDKKGFLANITVADAPLNKLATISAQDCPDNIARLGFAIAQVLHPVLPPVSGIPENDLQKIQLIATALQKAERPVIITGSSSCSETVIKAAYNIVQSLRATGKDAGISFVFPECNSMGLALMNVPSLENALERIRTNSDCTVIVLENDIFRHIVPEKADMFLSRCKHLVVMDSLHNRTTEKAHVLIPSATFAEADGTLVNNEGRAQHYYQVYMPFNPHIKESWKWLDKIKKLKTPSAGRSALHPDECLAELESVLPQFENITGVMPSHQFRINGQSIPREPHRYSGRTAMRAHIAVSEAKPLQDGDSPLTYTMEGYPGIPPESLTPFFWSPGWNSGQAVNKYQQETGGALRNENPGVMLFKHNKDHIGKFITDYPDPFTPIPGKYLLLPQHQLFGSEEMSAYSETLSELIPDMVIALSGNDAKTLGVTDGAMIAIEKNEFSYPLPLKIRNDLKSGIVLVPAGYQAMPYFPWGSWVKLRV
ncbi:MAG TPA: NADH-quinone oxidoreductase subunit NuoG [Agriterribacter sp.]|nr:NADH-quinone oxidoreductase subunit NuoG [Agriterribacter sp.]